MGFLEDIFGWIVNLFQTIIDAILNFFSNIGIG